MRYKRSQLNAISKYYTDKSQNEAREWLVTNYGILFADYCLEYGYKASPCTLMNSIKSGCISTMQKVIRLQNKLKEEE